MEKSKLKYFIYYFLLLPVMVGILYLIIDFLVLHYLMGNEKYRIMHHAISCLLLAVLTLCLTLFFNHKSEPMKDFSRYVIVFHISFLFSSVLHFRWLNPRITFSRHYDFSLSEVSDVYHGTAVLLTAIPIIFFFIISYERLKFKKLHIVILLLTMILQYLMYNCGIVLTGVW